MVPADDALQSFLKLAAQLQREQKLPPGAEGWLAEMARRVASGAPVLHVARDASWFQWDGGPRAELGPRRAAVRILAALVQRHLDGAGRPLSVLALRDAGWPGEAMLTVAARNRVHVTLAYLRRAGLRHAIVRREGGYVLAPGLCLHVEGEP